MVLNKLTLENSKTEMSFNYIFDNFFYYRSFCLLYRFPNYDFISVNEKVT